MSETAPHLTKSRSADSGHRRETVKELFKIVLELFATGALVVLVFDGPDRPLVKRKTRVRRSSQLDSRIEENLQRLARALGMLPLYAPNEAEAELACLNKQGHLDAIISVSVAVKLLQSLAVLIASLSTTRTPSSLAPTPLFASI